MCVGREGGRERDPGKVEEEEEGPQLGVPLSLAWLGGTCGVDVQLQRVHFLSFFCSTTTSRFVIFLLPAHRVLISQKQTLFLCSVLRVYEMCFFFHHLSGV